MNGWPVTKAVAVSNSSNRNCVKVMLAIKKKTFSRKSNLKNVEIQRQS